MSDKYPGGFVTTGAPAGFSVAFDGTGDYLSVNNAAFNFSSTDFTIEFWLYNTGTTSDTMLLQWGSGASGDIQFVVNQGGTSGAIALGTSGVAKTAASVSANNRWVYVAGVRSGTTYYTYVDGTRYTTQSSGTPSSSTSFNIASGMTGYISNLRISNTARYTSTTMVVPNILQTDANTKLWTCLGYPIVDQSGNSYTITINGDTKVSNFTPLQGYTGFNPALGAAAGGVWTLDEAAYYQNNRQWPIYDPYFKNTTLMLHGNGTNAAQNNTFLDSSTNNFTITRNGNTTQGTFSPFSQTGWSNYFSSSYLSASATLISTTATTFTMEGWIYMTATPVSNLNIPGLCGDMLGGSGTNYMSFGPLANLTLGFQWNNGSTNVTAAGNSVMSLNTWYHVAVSVNASSIKLFVNGVDQTITGTSTLTNRGGTTSTFTIAYNSTQAGVTGYVSNIRVTNTAVYTSSFTPNTAPLTAITGTLLLTCQSSRFVDSSANNYAITATSSPSVQAFSPFVPAYITPTTYSNKFDGSGDYLSLASNAAFTFGTGDFTIEAWVYNTNSSTGRFVLYSTNSPGTSGGLTIFQESLSLIYFRIDGGNDLTTTAPSINAWNHIAVTRASGTVRIFINGILSTSATRAQDITQNTPYIGDFPTGSYSLNGCMSNFRILKGTALYTANFTPPNAPLTNITNTSLLTCQSSTFIDNSSNNFTITANGNTVPVTSPTPFPAKVDTTTLNSAYSTSLIGGSGYFDGTGDYLNFTDSTNIFNGNFTAECWFYRLGGSAGDHNHLLGNSSDSSTGFYWAIREGGSGLAFQVQLNGVIINYTYTSSQIPIGAWTYLAIVKSGSTITGYINGVSIASGTVSNATSGIGTTYLVGRGATSGAWSNQYLSGYLSSYRLSTTARTITVPTAPSTAIANTEFLANFTNGAIFDNTAKNVLETVGNAQISTTQSKWGGSSMYFDGTGDYLLLQGGQNFTFGTGDFTIEMWIYVNSGLNTDIVYYDGRPTSTNGVYNIIYTNSTGKLIYSTNSADRITGTTTLSTSTWYHIALSRSGTSTKLFLNGTQEGSTYTDSNSYIVGTNRPVIAGNGFTLGNAPLNGYIDDLRITKGVARYITNFTPPTSQLQDQ